MSIRLEVSVVVFASFFYFSHDIRRVKLTRHCITRRVHKPAIKAISNHTVLTTTIPTVQHLGVYFSIRYGTVQTVACAGVEETVDRALLFPPLLYFWLHYESTTSPTDLVSNIQGAYPNSNHTSLTKIKLFAKLKNCFDITPDDHVFSSSLDADFTRVAKPRSSSLESLSPSDFICSPGPPFPSDELSFFHFILRFWN